MIYNVYYLYKMRQKKTKHLSLESMYVREIVKFIRKLKRHYFTDDDIKNIISRMYITTFSEDIPKRHLSLPDYTEEQLYRIQQISQESYNK